MRYAAREDIAESVRAFLTHVLTELEGKAGIAVLSVPVPFAPLSTFLRAAPRELSVMWDTGSRGGYSFAAAGAAVRIDLSGASRLDQLKAQARAVWQSLGLFDHPECPKMPPPRIFGGISFVPSARWEEPWSEYGDGCFTLPRWTYGRDGEHAFLRLAVVAQRDCSLDGRHRLLGELDEILDALEAYEGQTTTLTYLTVPKIPESAVAQMPQPLWTVYIERIRAAIRSGAFSKIVAGRRADVALDGPIDDLEVLTRLAAEPNCTRFAFRRSRVSFIGASPETLLEKQGTKLMTQALAGTIRSLGSEMPVLSQRSSQLMTSGKDRLEHDLVVKEICETLRPFSREIRVPEAPQVSKIRNILHLNTPIEATLRDRTEPADLLAAMHPTPAVGGFPKREAAAWIADNEPLQRGWYTGAVGWIDAVNDATFVVCIRCGTVGTDRACVFTGAGIVADSQADAEYAETALKQLPMLRALGVVV
jgi:isochorismate synthase